MIRNCIIILLFLQLFILHHANGQDIVGDSWEQVITKGDGRLVVYWHEVEPSIYKRNGQLSGIEFELIQAFKKFTENTYGITLFIEWVEIDDMALLIENVNLSQHKGALAVGNISITKERKNKVNFTSPFFPDLNIIISTSDIKPATSINEFKNNFKGATAYTFRESTLEMDLLSIRENIFDDFNIQYIDFSDDIFDIIIKDEKQFGYTDISVYLHRLKSGYNVNRHNVFPVIREGYGIMYSKNTDWEEPINNYFKKGPYHTDSERLVKKHLGDDIFNIISETVYSGNIQTGRELDLIRKEKEIQSQNLSETQSQLEQQTVLRNYFILVAIIVMITAVFLFYLFLANKRRNLQLATKNDQIEEQKAELAQTVQSLELLSKIGKDVTASLSTSKVEEVLYKHVKNLMDADEFGIGLYHEEKGEVIYRDYYRFDERVPSLVTKGNETNRLSFWCIKNQKDVFMGNVPVESHKYLKDLSAYKDGDLLSSNITIPIILDEEAIGILFVQSKRRDAYSESDFNLLRNLAVYASIALQNSRSFEELREKNRLIAEYNEELSIQTEEIKVQKENLEEVLKAMEKVNEDINLLSKVGQEIMSSRSIDEILELTYNNVNKLMDAEGFGIGYFIKEEHALEFKGFIEKGRRLPTYQNKLDDTSKPAVICFKKEEDILINNLGMEYHKYFDQKPIAIEGDLPESLIYLPLKVEKGMVGVVTVQSFKKFAYTQNNANVLKNLANYIALAIDNAYAYSQIDNQKKEIVDMNHELLELNEEKNHFIGVVAHDLRAPLNQIEGLASILKMSPSANNGNGEIIERIESSAKRLKKMISSILDISAIESKNLNVAFEDLSLNEIIAFAVEELKVYADQKHMALTFKHNKNDSIVHTDKALLLQVIENLMSNAIKFSPKNREVKIDIQLKDEKVIVGIHDQGPGISTDDLTKLFGQFQTLSAKPTAGESSTGLGLSIVKKYMDAMGGRVWYESNEGKGASFFIELDAV